MEKEKTIDGAHEAVDLGLSVKWAICNVGAASPEELGGYFAWGETEEKSDYCEATYLHGNRETGVCYNIGNNITDTMYDVAHERWGGKWRMPTDDEMDELNKKCSREWTVRNGVNGVNFTGPNGNCIFLPAAGYYHRKDVCDYNSKGYYWSGLCYKENYDLAFFLSMCDQNYLLCGFRLFGCSVRPVCDKW